MTRSRLGPAVLGSAIIGLLSGAALIVDMSAAAQVDRSGQTIPEAAEWRFGEPQPDWRSSLPIPGFEAARLERTADALRVTLPMGSAITRRISAGGIYVDLPDWRREEWTELVVRARTTSSVHTMRIGLNAREGAPATGAAQPSPQSVFLATFQVSGGVTPIVRDGLVHTYRIHLDWGNQQTGPWRRIGLQFQALVPGTIDILSVRVVPAAAEQTRGRITETTLEPPQLRSDFALFRRALEEAHPALYRYTTKRDLDAQFARAEAQLTRSMTLLQFRNVLAPVRAAIKDGYGIATSTNQGDEISTVVNSAKQFPLALTFQSRRAFVLLNQGLDDRVKPGMEVLAINGQSFAEILSRILPNVGQYGDGRTWPMYQLGIPGGFSRRGLPGRTGFGEAYRLYVGNPPSFRTTLRDPETRVTRVVDLVGVTLAEAAANAKKNSVNSDVLTGLETLRALSTPQSIRYLDGETAILVPAWGVNAPDFLKEVFAGLKNKGVKNLIVDVRGNTGGFDQIPVILFSYLTSKEFRAFERVYMKTYTPSFSRYTVVTDIDPVDDPYYGSVAGIWKPDPGGGWLMTEKYSILGVKQPADDNFHGAVYVLIDGGSISATAEFCATVDYYKRATFIGEETGGAAEGDTGGGDINPTLPESHLQIRIPGEAYFSVVDQGNRRRGTLPKHVVVQTVDDLVRGRDTVLEFTRELIRSGKER